jgi:hypothetical protein
VIGSFASRAALRGALTLFAVIGLQSAAQAAFSISVNGTVVATDGGPGDRNSSAGEIEFRGVVNGYDFHIATSVFQSAGATGIDTAILQIVQVGGNGTLSIVISGTFEAQGGVPSASTLSSVLTRDVVAGHSTSGVGRLTTMATSASGSGSGSTDEIALSQNEWFGTASGAFLRTSNEYTLAQEFIINGLGRDKGVLLGGESRNLIHAPEPSSAALLLGGLGFLACAGRLRRYVSR